MSHSQPVQSSTAQGQLSATLGPMPPPRPVINRTEAQQARVTHLIDLMQQLVKQMDVFWEVQIQTPHIPQSATQVREILAVLLPEITTLGPELREHEQAQVMGMLHHVTQRVDAVSTAHIQATQVLEEEQATLAAEIEKLTDQEEKANEDHENEQKDINKMPDLQTAALKAQLTMKSTLTECLAELDSELRKEMRKKYL
ncbi:hypothetical protein GGH93_003617 [Coemansia aciculifera]|nr:hypothetical protein GGH93_003617 [Coemansia aciculifera]